MAYKPTLPFNVPMKLLIPTWNGKYYTQDSVL